MTDAIRQETTPDPDEQNDVWLIRWVARRAGSLGVVALNNFERDMLKRAADELASLRQQLSDIDKALQAVCPDNVPQLVGEPEVGGRYFVLNENGDPIIDTSDASEAIRAVGELWSRLSEECETLSGKLTDARQQLSEAQADRERISDEHAVLINDLLAALGVPSLDVAFELIAELRAPTPEVPPASPLCGRCVGEGCSACKGSGFVAPASSPSASATGFLIQELRRALSEEEAKVRNLTAENAKLMDGIERVGISRGTVNRREVWWWNDRNSNEPCAATLAETADALWAEYLSVCGRAVPASSRLGDEPPTERERGWRDAINATCYECRTGFPPLKSPLGWFHEQTRSNAKTPIICMAGAIHDLFASPTPPEARTDGQ